LFFGRRGAQPYEQERSGGGATLAKVVQILQAASDAELSSVGITSLALDLGDSQLGVDLLVPEYLKSKGNKTIRTLLVVMTWKEKLITTHRFETRRWPLDRRTLPGLKLVMTNS